MMCLFRFSSFGTQIASEAQLLNVVLELARRQQTIVAFKIARIHFKSGC